MKPRVLIATTSRWFPPARLGMALASVGFSVDAVGPTRHPIASIRALDQRHVYHALAPLKSFESAALRSRPDIIVPCDDTAVEHLHRLYQIEQERGRARGKICALIERSIGAPEWFEMLQSRTDITSLAAELSVAVPETEAILSSDGIPGWASRVGFPFAVKADGTSGGEGVRIVASIKEAERAYRKLYSPPALGRALKRALVDQDMSLFWPSLLRKPYRVSGQAYVQGVEATSTVACWKGNVLASLHFEVLSRRSETGASTALRLIEDPGMTSAVKAIIGRLKLSGLVGFDFMLDRTTGKSFLIELNPRATQVGHLALGPGRDLAAALFAAVSGTPVRERPKVTECDMVTLFPHEWLRNAESPWLRCGYHDVPWDEVEFIRLCVGTRRKQQTLYSQRGWTTTLSTERAK